MKKITIICFTLAVLFIQNASGQTLGDLYVNSEAGFSMSMPENWQTYNVNMKYLAIVGPQDGEFTPNINFGDEEYSGLVSEYIDELFEYLPMFFNDFKVQDRTDFRTNNGLTGECITYLAVMGTVNVKQKMYIISNRRRTSVMIITCTSPPVTKDIYDIIFDESVRTLNWTR